MHPDPPSFICVLNTHTQVLVSQTNAILLPPGLQFCVSIKHKNQYYLNISATTLSYTLKAVESTFTWSSSWRVCQTCSTGPELLAY